MQIKSKLTYTLLFASGFQSQASTVLELTEDTFDGVVADRDIIMTMFYAPWCSHCQRFLPEYEKAAQLLTNTDINLTKVDCEEHKSFCKSKGVAGYPTVKYYRQGLPFDYTSIREAHAIAGFLKRAALPPVSPVAPAYFDKFIRYDKVVVLGFFDQNSDLTNIYHTVANTHHDMYAFGHAADRELAIEHGVPFPGLAVFKQYDEHKDIFAGEHTLDAITSFIHQSAQPSIIEMTPSNYLQLLGAKQPLAYIFFTTDEEHEFYHNKLSQVARRVANELKFVFVNSNLYGAHAQEVGLSPIFPTFTIQTFNPDANSPIDQSVPLTPEGILNYLKHFLKSNPNFTFNLDDFEEDRNEPTDFDEL